VRALHTYKKFSSGPFVQLIYFVSSHNSQI
jgi:hypothetical protein